MLKSRDFFSNFSNVRPPRFKKQRNCVQKKWKNTHRSAKPAPDRRPRVQQVPGTADAERASVPDRRCNRRTL